MLLGCLEFYVAIIKNHCGCLLNNLFSLIATVFDFTMNESLIKGKILIFLTLNCFHCIIATKHFDFYIAILRTC